VALVEQALLGTRDRASIDERSIILYSIPVQLEEVGMLQTTYTNARANLAGLCDEVTENREIVVIRRRKGNNVAMIAADELQSLVESVHLMRSPKNAERLLSALERALKGSGKASSVPSLRSEVGLDD
jgi:antitoxin YefM